MAMLGSSRCARVARLWCRGCARAGAAASGVDAAGAAAAGAAWARRPDGASATPTPDRQAIEQEIQRRIDAGLLRVVHAADAAAGAPPEGGAAPMEVDASGAAAALAAAAGANAADAVGAGAAGAAGAVVAGAAGAGAGVPFVAVAPPPLPRNLADLAVAEATLRHCEHVALEGQQLSPAERGQVLSMFRDFASSRWALPDF